MGQPHQEVDGDMLNVIRATWEVENTEITHRWETVTSCSNYAYGGCNSWGNLPENFQIKETVDRLISEPSRDSDLKCYFWK